MSNNEVSIERSLMDVQYELAKICEELEKLNNILSKYVTKMEEKL